VHKKVGVPIFAYSRQNRLPWQSSLNDRITKVGMIMPTHMCTYPENLVKIGPVHFEVIRLSRGSLKDERK